MKSNRSKPGQKISTRMMQDVPLPGGKRVRAGAKVIGEVVSVRPESPAQNAALTIRFDKVMIGKKGIPITTNLRALCGLYDYGDLVLKHAGRTDPQGEIILESARRNVHLRSGSGMLLRAIP